MTVRKTSRDAFHEIEASGRLSAQERQIMLWMHGQPKGKAYFRRELAALIGIPINAIAGRCNSLVAKGFLEELESELDPVTGHKACPVRVKAIQEELKLEAA